MGEERHTPVPAGIDSYVKRRLLEPGEYFGTTSRRKEIGEFTVAETTYAPCSELPRHAHTNPYFCLVLAGGYAERGDGKVDWECRPGSVLFHPPGMPHANLFTHAFTRCLNVEVAETWLRRATDPPLGWEAPIHLPPGAPSVVATLLQRELRGSDEFSTLVVEGLVRVLLGETRRAVAAPAGRTPPPWLDQCLELLQARFAETVSLETLAAAAGVHPSHLSRVFRSRQGCTVGEYLRRIRIEHVRRALETTDASLAEIAFATGFADQSHLTRTFRAHVGTTPGRYRRAIRGR